MFEAMTYEAILRDALARVPADMDTREGSIIYDAIAPACAELAQAYIALDNVLNQTFADTSTGEYLERRTGEHGITREPATYAVVRATFEPSDVDVMDKRFSCGEYNYRVTSRDAKGYLLTCETAGASTNGNTGTLIPIEYVQGLKVASITSIEKPAEDEETDTHLRARFYASLRDTAFGGNIADYKEKVHKLEGVGGVKVTPVWNGGGTVLLTIQASDYSVPSEYLVNEVQQQIDPSNDASGVGIAPIGHIVTVKGATSVPINVSTTLTYADGWSYEQAKIFIDETIDKYLLELRQDWENNDTTIVRLSMIESRLLDCDGIIDVENTTLNGSDHNLQLGKYELPVRGVFNE